MATNLTRKQRKFVKEYLATGNATESALQVYDTDDREVASVIGSQNLTKVNVQNAIQESLKDEDLALKHKQLLNQKKIEYFVFPKKMSDEEITEKVNNVGIEIINIQEGEKGKYAFYHTADAQTQKGALEMAYKIKGTYAPTKSINLNLEAEIDPEDIKLAEQLKELERNNSTETQST